MPIIFGTAIGMGAYIAMDGSNIALALCVCLVFACLGTLAAS